MMVAWISLFNYKNGKAVRIVIKRGGLTIHNVLCTRFVKNSDRTLAFTFINEVGVKRAAVGANSFYCFATEFVKLPLIECPLQSPTAASVHFSPTPNSVASGGQLNAGQ